MQTFVKRTHIAIALIAMTTILVVIALWKKPISWKDHYNHDSKDPYGTSALYAILKDKPITFLEENPSNCLPIHDSLANYLFIGNQWNNNEYGIRHIQQFVANGNRAFIFTPELPYQLIPKKIRNACPSDSLNLDAFGFAYANLNLVHPNLKLPKPTKYQMRIENDIVTAQWHYVPDNIVCKDATAVEVLGLISDYHPNFIRVNYGKGFLFFHTTPLVFSNYHLLRPETHAYVEGILSHVGTGPIYWDLYSKYPPENAIAPQKQRQTFNRDHPLRYIVSQPPLAWAWYTIVTMAILFVTLYAKRTQRIIPVLEPRTNTSLEFVSAIGRLYFIQHNHKKLSLQKIKLFQLFIRERYGLYPGAPDFEQKLSDKSGLHPDTITQLISTQQRIEEANFVSETLLVDLHRLTEQFYKQAK